jgi:4-hydroxy-tetrahydrodipicolinate synthase
MTIPVFEGIITVVTTPFDGSGAIDLDVLGRHLDWLIAQGVHAILPGGTTGEYQAQSLSERRRVLECVAERVAGRVPLYAGTNSARRDETIELAAAAEALGYRAQMLAAPFYSLPSPGELARHFRFVAEHTGLPIILYNFPARTGVDMDRAFLEAVADLPSICAIKESSGSFARMLDHVLTFDRRYQRICGADDQAVDAFLWGARSFIAGASNFLPAEHVALWETCVLAGDYRAGQAMMRRLLPLFSLLEQGGKYVQYVKYGTELAGFPVGPARPPLGELDPAEKAAFRALYKEVVSAGLGAGGDPV